jgi:hypothetical protein
MVYSWCKTLAENNMTEDTSQYGCPFINQYIKIPKNISDKVNAKHPTESEGIRHCIGIIVVNLLTNGIVAYSRNKNFYTKNLTKYYTWTNMLKAVQIASADGYAIELQKGYWNKDFLKGLSSTLGAGPRLKEFQPCEEMELDVESLPLLSVDGRPVFGEEGLAFITSHANSDTLLPQLNKALDEALRLNREYWNRMEIDCRNLTIRERCMGSVGLTRVFKNGEVGRWYQKGGLSYQELPERTRAHLFLNSEEVVELDYQAMHPHILYAWEGKQCPDDFYERIMEMAGCSRFIAKSVTLIAINTNSPQSLVGAINLEKGKQTKGNKDCTVPKPILYDELKKDRLSPKDIVHSVEEAHPILKKYIYSESANKLMLKESDIMTSVLLRLMELHIPALPVHDSVIVPSQHKEIGRSVMESVYNQNTSFEIIVV